jgi:hypothetical protein
MDVMGGVVVGFLVWVVIRVVLTGFYSFKGYEAPLRRIRFKDPETGNTLAFLTNNFVLPALTITKLYRCRWQVELFFKWIKQHLRIKSFYGVSENAVHIQLWVSICTYVLVVIARKQLNLTHLSLYTVDLRRLTTENAVKVTYDLAEGEAIQVALILIRQVKRLIGFACNLADFGLDGRFQSGDLAFNAGELILFVRCESTFFSACNVEEFASLFDKRATGFLEQF